MPYLNGEYKIHKLKQTGINPIVFYCIWHKIQRNQIFIYVFIIFRNQIHLVSGVFMRGEESRVTGPSQIFSSDLYLLKKILKYFSLY